MDKDKNLYVVIIFLIFALTIYFSFSPVKSIVDKAKELKEAKVKLEQTEKDLVRAKELYQKQEERKKKVENLSDTLKKIYKPAFVMEGDFQVVFGQMIKDITEMAAASKLKFRSIDFFTVVEQEPLLLGISSAKIDDVASPQTTEVVAVVKSKGATPPQPAPVQTLCKGYQLNMEVVGSFLNIKQFLDLLNKYPYLVKLAKVETYPYAANPNILVANIGIILYADISQ